MGVLICQVLQLGDLKVKGVQVRYVVKHPSLLYSGPNQSVCTSPTMAMALEQMLGDTHGSFSR